MFFTRERAHVNYKVLKASEHQFLIGELLLLYNTTTFTLFIQATG